MIDIEEFSDDVHNSVMMKAIHPDDVWKLNRDLVGSIEESIEEDLKDLMIDIINKSCEAAYCRLIGITSRALSLEQAVESIVIDHLKEKS